ncbi:aminodeoxychorismate synthase component I [Solidesulfovibrio sp.]
MKGDAVFVSTAPDGRHSVPGWSRAFSRPRWTGSAGSLHEVRPTLQAALAAQGRDGWLVLALAYEAAPAFDPGLPAHPPTGEPLLFAAVYDAPCPPPPSPDPGCFSMDCWQPAIPRRDYGRGLAAIAAHIRLGDVYQVNYTFPLHSRFQGDPADLFAALAARQQAGFCCRLDMGGQSLLSLSPELFFLRQGERVTVRPMKGTLPRGTTPETDAAQAAALAGCPKNRSENRMITDLMRNDLGRIARPGSVAVADLFAVQPLWAAWQMTTTVTADIPRAIGLDGLLAALFPCGSITGAPKASAMGLIRDLEPFPRGFYTGTIGWVAPDGDCALNVAIRTVTLDHATGRCRFGVGGGITHDSREADEYAECRIKARFLDPPAPAWQLLETLRLANGRFAFLEEHLTRLTASAAHYRFALDRAAVLAALDRVREAWGRQPRRVRLLVGPDGAVATETFPLPDRLSRPAIVGLCPEPVNAADPALGHKTTRRDRYARALAARPDCDDVLLVNTAGQVTESCLANLVIRRDGHLVTPAAACGLLPGTYRARLLARGVLAEAVVTPADLLRAEAVWLINSVRLWTRAVLAPSDAARETAS